MKPPRYRRDAVLLIAGLAAGFLLSPPVVQAAANHSPRSETAVRSAAAASSQEVLLSARTSNTAPAPFWGAAPSTESWSTARRSSRT